MSDESEQRFKEDTISLIYIAWVSVVLALPVMFLWNWLMPVLFDLTVITYAQTFGLLMLRTLIMKVK